MGNICVACPKTRKRPKIYNKTAQKPEIADIQINVIRSNWKLLKLDIASIGTMAFVRYVIKFRLFYMNHLNATHLLPLHGNHVDR